MAPVLLILSNIVGFFIGAVTLPIPRPVASLINIAGFFIVPVVLWRFRGKQCFWLKFAMLLLLAGSFAIYHVWASATQTDRAITLYGQALACRLLVVLLGTYALVRYRRQETAPSS